MESKINHVTTRDCKTHTSQYLCTRRNFSPSGYAFEVQLSICIVAIAKERKARAEKKKHQSPLCTNESRCYQRDQYDCKLSKEIIGTERNVGLAKAYREKEFEKKCNFRVKKKALEG